eukprot:scaffold48010_cov17-Prasinocladus_malaysianus.AAC.1
MFSKYAGTEVEANEESYMLLKDDDVLGTMPTSNVADLKPTGDRVLIQVGCEGKLLPSALHNMSYVAMPFMICILL